MPSSEGRYLNYKSVNIDTAALRAMFPTKVIVENLKGDPNVLNYKDNQISKMTKCPILGVYLT